VHFTVKQLDGRTLAIKSPAGAVIKPGSFQVVRDEGMPMHGRPMLKGNLYINFEVRGTRTARWEGGVGERSGQSTVEWRGRLG
jgi:DnaJ-class molecular chaperone